MLIVLPRVVLKLLHGDLFQWLVFLVVDEAVLDLLVDVVVVVVCCAVFVVCHWGLVLMDMVQLCPSEPVMNHQT